MLVLQLLYIGRRKPNVRQPRLRKRLNTASCQCNPAVYYTEGQVSRDAYTFIMWSG